MKNFNQMTKDEKHIFTLHKYYIHATLMHKHFQEELQKAPTKENNPYSLDTQIYMSLWYGMLYVVIEGWQNLELKDEVIDKLLDGENTRLLKLYRNGMFHYQRKYNDKRFENFYSKPTTVKWIQEVHSGFSKWFLKELQE